MQTKKLNLEPGEKNWTFSKKNWNFFFWNFLKNFSEKNYSGKKMISFDLLLGSPTLVWHFSSGPRKKNRKKISGNIRTERKKNRPPTIFRDFWTYNRHNNRFQVISKKLRGVFLFSVDAEFYADSRVLYEKFRFSAKFDTRRVWKVIFCRKSTFWAFFMNFFCFVNAGEKIQV